VVVSELFEDMAKMIASAASPGIVLRIDAAPDLAVSGDPAQLRQLLWNLCRNAEQAMGEEGTLTLEARSDESRSPQEVASEGRHKAGGTGPGDVEIIVRDSGPGIRGEVLERIFDPFFTTKSEGTGLGLATVHRIVEGHGGSLRVETQLGRGTAFRVRLTRHRESA
jgi:signal transduction histidine kinase